MKSQHCNPSLLPSFLPFCLYKVVLPFFFLSFLISSFLLTSCWTLTFPNEPREQLSLSLVWFLLSVRPDEAVTAARCSVCVHSLQSHQWGGPPAQPRLSRLHSGHLQLPPGDGGAGGGHAHHTGRRHHPAHREQRRTTRGETHLTDPNKENISVFIWLEKLWPSLSSILVLIWPSLNII